jgi:hypothetical protein
MAAIGGASAIAAALILLVTDVGWWRHPLGQDGPGLKSLGWPVVAVLVLLIFPAIAIHAQVQGVNRAWFGGVTAAAVMGFAVMAVARTMLFVETVHPAAVAMGAIGFVPVALWLLSLSMIGIRDGDVPILLAVPPVIAVILAVCGIGAATIRDQGSARCFVGVLMIVMTCWLLVIAVHLFRAA